MGFWDREVRGSFDRMFDFNHDGVLDRSEETMQLLYMEDECLDRKYSEPDDDEFFDEDDEDYDDEGSESIFSDDDEW